MSTSTKPGTAAVVGPNQASNNCFGCSLENPIGLHLQFAIDAANPNAIGCSVTTRLTSLHEGPPGYVHGGIIATLLDEAMAKLNRPLQVIAMTRHMEVDYLRPVPINVAIKISGHHTRRDGRKLFHTAQIVDSAGHVLAKAKGVFVVADPAKLAARALRQSAVAEPTSAPV